MIYLVFAFAQSFLVVYLIFTFALSFIVVCLVFAFALFFWCCTLYLPCLDLLCTWFTVFAFTLSFLVVYFVLHCLSLSSTLSLPSYLAFTFVIVWLGLCFTCPCLCLCIAGCFTLHFCIVSLPSLIWSISLASADQLPSPGLSHSVLLCFAQALGWSHRLPRYSLLCDALIACFQCIIW